jgi:acyl-[acyl-carrier-protein]-phospholipid O-acyltransferase/long-chain-fatty-acid--[acyl-carrier-protein] ligase
LPFFHSFGLGIGVLLPVLYGCKVFLYPTPLHFQTIPKLIEKTRSTVFFSTDTFLKKYIPHIEKSNFKNLKYLIAGAEKVEQSTHDKYHKHDIQILEGYGVTEASPAVSVNTKENYKIGSVGKFITGIEYRIEKIDGYAEGGLLFIKGKNIITRYFGQQQEFDWYNTGDVVRVDEEGYLFILGRLKRFAKIAGEMISLSQIEEFPKKLWPDNNNVVCSIKDNTKGEALILLTDNKKADLSVLTNFMKEEGLSNLYLPKKIKIISEFPILGSGKINYKKLQEISES